MMTDQHEHEWQRPADDDATTRWVCAWCPQVASSCTECARPVEDHVVACGRCVGRARQWVRDVVEAIETVPFHHAELMGLRSPRYDRDVVHGGGDRDRLPFGMDAVVEDPEDPRIAAVRHPQSAVDVLRRWAWTWAEVRGDGQPRDDLAYLIDHTLWAVQNPDASGWVAYRDEAREVRATVRRLLGLQPVREPAPCVHCGGDVVREWLTDGLDDVRRCTRCGMTWPDEERLRFTNHLRILAAPVTDPDTLVTLEQARVALPDLKRNTLNQVLKRDRDRTDPGHPSYDATWTPRLPTRGTTARGEELYRLGDVTALVTRPGVAAS